MYQCEHCNTTFKTLGNLNKHKKSARYCLSKQPQTITKDIVCEYCKKTFTRTDNLTRHLKLCKIASTEKTELLTQIEDNRQADLVEIKSILDKLVQDVSDRPTVVQNMDPVTVANIEAMALEYLDICDIEKGIEGIIDFTVKYPLQGRVVCTDRSRKKFKYTDEEGNVINDYGGKKLSKTVFEGIHNRCQELIDEKYASLAKDIEDSVTNNEGFKDEVLKKMKQSVDLQNIKMDLDEASHGIVNAFQKKYIKGLMGRI